jgi:hypothetical protein
MPRRGERSGAFALQLRGEHLGVDARLTARLGGGVAFPSAQTRWATVPTARLRLSGDATSQ